MILVYLLELCMLLVGMWTERSRIFYLQIYSLLASFLQVNSSVCQECLPSCLYCCKTVLVVLLEQFGCCIFYLSLVSCMVSVRVLHILCYVVCDHWCILYCNYFYTLVYMCLLSIMQHVFHTIKSSLKHGLLLLSLFKVKAKIALSLSNALIWCVV